MNPSVVTAPDASHERSRAQSHITPARTEFCDENFEQPKQNVWSPSESILGAGAVPAQVDTAAESPLTGHMQIDLCQVCHANLRPAYNRTRANSLCKIYGNDNDIRPDFYSIYEKPLCPTN
ncbi:hypothetical protein J6590_017793 [Homalodisca vitripennis]|nr:hypothetical protein J6590_017793 [Homalodisca vitripennis]